MKLEDLMVKLNEIEDRLERMEKRLAGQHRVLLEFLNESEWQRKEETGRKSETVRCWYCGAKVCKTLEYCPRCSVYLDMRVR